MIGSCDCCQKKDVEILVACSSLGAFSLGYCRPCAEAGAEPEGIIQATVDELGGVEGVRQCYRDTIKFYKNGEYHHFDQIGKI